MKLCGNRDQRHGQCCCTNFVKKTRVRGENRTTRRDSIKEILDPLFIPVQRCPVPRRIFPIAVEEERSAQFRSFGMRHVNRCWQIACHKTVRRCLPNGPKYSTARTPIFHCDQPVNELSDFLRVARYRDQPLPDHPCASQDAPLGNGFCRSGSPSGMAVPLRPTNMPGTLH